MEFLDAEHITPAIKHTENEVNNQLTSQEFQTTLYYWFNQKGIVSDMRSYLRMKMINALKSTVIGESLKTNVNIHLEDQAFNILIADYLFQHGYDYSLSVFSTEVPIKTLVSEFCFFLFNKENTQYRHKINEENVISVIELLGINGNSELAREVLTTYKQLDNGSLLFCILKIAMNYYKPEVSSEEGKIEEIGKVIKKIVIHYDLPSSVINHMIEKLNSIVRSHVKNFTENLNKHHEQEKYILRAEYKNKEDEFKQKLEQVDKYLNEEANKIDKEHRKLVYLTETMVMNEKKLLEKSKEMENRIRKMNELEIKLAENIEHRRKSKASDKDSIHSNKTCNLPHCDQECERNAREIEQLRSQKSDFERIIENQNILISNLTDKTKMICKQLQDSMSTIDNLNQQLEKQKMLLELEKSRREHVSEKTITSSEALTIGTDGEGDHNAEDAIRESHYKLEQLERESYEIEQKFKRFQLNLRHK